MLEYESSRKHVAVTPRIRLVTPSARTISRPTLQKSFETMGALDTLSRNCWRTCGYRG
jgi:hypothetical protein